MSAPLHLDEATHKAIQAGFARGRIYLDSSKIEEIAGGAIRVPAYFGRAHMVLVYGKEDPGGARREYVPPESLFDKGAMASLCDVPLSVWHPNAREVNGGNWREVASGHITSDVAEGDEYLTGYVVINDEWAIERVRDKSHPEHLCELSPGYLAESVEESGTSPNGEAYTHRQLARTYNHMALLPKNYGRSGRDIALRLDQRGEPMPGDTVEEEKKDPPPFTDAQVATIGKIVSDALAAFAAANKKTDQAPPAPAPKVDPKAEPKLDAKAKAEAEDRRFNDAVDLREKARRVLGEEYSFSNKTQRQVMTDACLHVDATFEVGDMSDDRLRGEFEGLVRLDAANKRFASEDRGILHVGDGEENTNNDANAPNGLSKRTQDAWKKGKAQ